MGRSPGWARGECSGKGGGGARAGSLWAPGSRCCVNRFASKLTPTGGCGLSKGFAGKRTYRETRMPSDFIDIAAS